MSGELTDKQQAFIDHYVACLNGAEAARRAGYAASGARQEAHRLLTNADIRAALDAKLAESVMPANEILARLTDQARGSMADLFAIKGRGLTLNLKQAADLGVLHLVKRYSKTRQGVTVELYDAQAALTLLARYYRLFGDDGGGILKYIDLSKLSPEQLQRLRDGDDILAVLLNTSTTSSGS